MKSLCSSSDKTDAGELSSVLAALDCHRTTNEQNRAQCSMRFGLSVTTGKLGYHESQVHTLIPIVFRAEDVAPCRIYSFYSRKEYSCGGYRHTCQTACNIFEPAVPSRTDRHKSARPSFSRSSFSPWTI